MFAIILYMNDIIMGDGVLWKDDMITGRRGGAEIGQKMYAINVQPLFAQKEGDTVIQNLCPMCV